MSSALTTVQRMPPGTYFGVSKVSRQVGSVGLAESEYTAGMVLPEHAHEQPHFVFVVKGHYEETLGGTCLERQPAQVLFLPRDVPHTERHLTSGLHFMIDPPQSCLDRLELLAGELPRVPDMVHAEGLPLAIGLRREFWEPTPNSVLAVEALTLQLLALFTGKGSKTREPHGPRFLRQVVCLLSQPFTEHLTIEQLARLVGVHPAHLARTFLRWHGRPLRKFLQERRLQFAYAQLLRKSATLADVATSAGFCDQSHFGRAFLERFGISPGKFKRQASRSRR